MAPYAKDATRCGVKLFAQVGDAAEAVEALEAGAVGVIVQGCEAGGHVKATRPLVETLSQTRAELSSLPVVAAGGIADGAGIADALALGADAASLGTRFVATPEAAVVPEYRERVVTARADDTVLTKLFDRGWPNAQHRVLRNRAFREWEQAGRPDPGARPGEGRIVAAVPGAEGRQELPRFSVVPPVVGFEGDLEEAPLYAGTSCQKIDSVEPVAAVMERLGRELRAARG